jgi:diadenosine tetraphosphate (Ap4A) HIT family hydrolase
MVLPRAHRRTIFDLTADDWDGTRHLLADVRELVVERHCPDGFNVGWNVETVGGQSVMHAHCHLIPRYHDEPYAGRGLRAWLKDPLNRPTRHSGEVGPS